MKQFLKYNFFQIVITFEIRLHAYFQNTWQEDYLIKETKDPFWHGDFDSMDMFTLVELIDLDRFSKKWAWHLANRISCKTFVYT